MTRAPAPASSPPPQIFATRRLAARRWRAKVRQATGGAARYLFADIAEDVGERLAFLRHSPLRSLVLGDPTGLVAGVAGAGADHVPDPDWPLDQPWPAAGYDLIVGAIAFDAVNDLPGALIHARAALAPGGLVLVTMLGAGSLPALRGIMLAADGPRPAPRLHPQVDIRAGAQLLQRAGFADPVVDSRGLDVRFARLEGLVSDLRDQGLTAVLAQGGAPLGKAAWHRARAAFTAAAAGDDRVTERFELLTLSGWRQRPPA